MFMAHFTALKEEDKVKAERHPEIFGKWLSSESNEERDEQARAMGLSSGGAPAQEEMSSMLSVNPLTKSKMEARLGRRRTAVAVTEPAACGKNAA